MDFTPQQKYSLLSKMGYTGSMQGDEMDAFLQSNPGAAAKMGKFNRALQRGFQTGGVVAPSGFTSPLTGVRQSYADAMSNLYKVQQESNAWSISGIETKETTTPSTSTSSSTTTPSRPSISGSEANEYNQLRMAARNNRLGSSGQQRLSELTEKVKASGLTQGQLNRAQQNYYRQTQGR